MDSGAHFSLKDLSNTVRKLTIFCSVLPQHIRNIEGRTVALWRTLSDSCEVITLLVLLLLKFAVNTFCTCAEILALPLTILLDICKTVAKHT